MKKGNKELIVVGDRVLLIPDIGEERSDVGLYLPKWAVEKESIKGGRVIATGPGLALPPPTDVDDEPWRDIRSEHRYLPMQAEEGDYAIFLRKAAVELKFEGENYLVVPQSAILVLVREEEQDKFQI